jgi:hypothetical protein
MAKPHNNNPKDAKETDSSKAIDETIELEGGDVEIEPEESKITIPTMSTKVDPVEHKDSRLALQIASELVELSKDVSRPISVLKGIVQSNLSATASREEAQAYFKFFERFKRIAESAYLTAQEITSAKL